jgi:hypothetical protein
MTIITTVKNTLNNTISAFTPSKKFIKQRDALLKKLTPSDGLDEVAVALISFLPKIAQPPVTAVSLAILTPFVRAGGREMAAEYQETLDTVKHLEDKKTTLQEKILSNPEFEKLLESKDKLPKETQETLEKINNYKGSNQKQIDIFIKADEYLKMLSKNSDQYPIDEQTKDINDFIVKTALTNPHLGLSVNNQKTDNNVILGNLNKIKIALSKKLNFQGVNNTRDTLLNDITHYQHNQAELKLANYPRTMQAGTFAMGGMTAGVAVGALKALAETAQQFGFKPELMNVTQNALGIATQVIFIPSQAAMVVFGVNKALQGLQKNKYLEEQKQALGTLKTPNNTDNTDMIDETKKHIDALKRNNMLGDVVYGIGTAAAETGMIIGGLMGAASILIPASLLTLGFTGLRMYAQSREAHLTGNAHDHEHNGNILKMLWKPKAETPKNTGDTATNHTHSTLCNHKTDTAFDDNINNVKNSFKTKLTELDNVKKEINYIKSKDFDKYSVENTKETLYNLLPEEEKKAAPLGMTFGNQQKTLPITPNTAYVNTIFNNKTTQELAIDILKAELVKEPRPQTQATTLALETLNADNPDETGLKTIFTQHQAILDKPENAKQIMPHLLTDRLNKIKQNRVFLMENLIHLGQKNKYS